MIKKYKKLEPHAYKSEDGEVTVYEYGELNEEMDISVAELKGNYPGEGRWSKNREVNTMTYFVISGSGIFRFEDGEKIELEPEDRVFIGNNRGYQVEIPEGVTLKVLMASNPAWRPDQYEVYS